MKQLFNQWLIHILWLMICYSNPSVLFSHWNDWGTFHSFAYILSEFIGKIYQMMCTAIIFSHLNELTFRILYQLVHISGIRTAEFINVLVIVAHCYNTHLFIIGYQGIHKVVFFFSHVLSLVYDKYCLTDLGWFHFPLINHFGSFRDDVFGILKVSYSS